jgi:hypothetical protein
MGGRLAGLAPPVSLNFKPLALAHNFCESVKTMRRAQQVLVWLMRFEGIVMLTALGAVFMPYEWMNVIHRHEGLGELPHAPIVDYLTRSISALYALHGGLLIFLSLDVVRYLSVIRFLAGTGIVFGALMLGLDVAAGMPVAWTIGEGPFIMALCGVFLWLAGRVQKQSADRA